MFLCNEFLICLQIEPCYSEDYTWDTCTGLHIVVTDLVISDKSNYALIFSLKLENLYLLIKV